MKHVITITDFDDMIADEFDVRATYSGRNMYRQECFGLVGSVDDLVKFIIYVAKYQADRRDSPQVEWFAENTCSDNMGRDMIFYWPNITVTQHGD